MLAGVLIMFGVIIGQFGAVIWWIDREVVDPDRLADIATAVVRDDQFRAAVAPEIADELLAAGLVELVDDRDVLIAAVESAMADPEVVRAVSDAITSVASTVIGDGGNSIVLELDGLHGAVVLTLQDIDPDLAAQVDGFETPDAIVLDAGRFPDLGAPIAALTVAWMIALGLGASLAVVGILIHPKPGKGFRRVGALMAIGAGIQIGLIWVIAEVVTANLPGDGLAAAGGIGLSIAVESWRVQAVVQLLAGGAIAIAGHIWLWLPKVARQLNPVAA